MSEIICDKKSENSKWNKINFHVADGIRQIDPMFWAVGILIWIKNIKFFSPDLFKKGLILCYAIIGINLILKKRHKDIRIICNVVLGCLAVILAYKNVKYIYMYLPFSLSILSAALFFRNRTRMIAYTVIDFICSFIIWIDLVYYRAYGEFTTIKYIANPRMFNSSSRNLLEYMNKYDVFYFIDLMLLIILAVKYYSIFKKRSTSILKRGLVSLLCIAVFGGWIGTLYYLYDYKDITNGKTYLFSASWATDVVAERAGSLAYHFAEVGDAFTENKHRTLTKSEKEEVEKWYDYNDENLPDNEYASLLQGKNIIFIQVESLENFVINETVDGEAITPNLNEMLKNSYYFDNVYEQVYRNSADGDLMGTTGLFPYSKKSVYLGFPFNSYNNIARIFKNMGYSTAAVHPENGGRWNWRDNHASQGFDYLYDNKDFDMRDVVGPTISDTSLYKQTVEKIKDIDGAFMFHLVTMSSHGPFTVSASNQNLKLKSSIKNSILGSYFQSINYVDISIGKLLGYLKEAGLLDNTVLVIYGDHSGPHRQYPDKVKALEGNSDIKESWLKDDRRVPFIIYNPSIEGKTIETIGGQIDILPTVFYLMGVEKSQYVDSMMGRNLLNTNRNATIMATGGIIGETSSEEEAQHLLDIRDISDKIFESDYFKGKY